MDRVRNDVCVIGAGVSGLTTAVRLAEAGLSVRVLAHRRGYGTASYAAGAIWGPYLAAHENADQWCGDTREVLEKLAGVPGTGVRMVAGTEAAVEQEDPPEWATLVSGYRPCGPGELPDGFGSGWSYTVPILDMPVYLEYLTDRLLGAGVQVQSTQVHSLSEAAQYSGIVVNCAGMGARDLVPDPDLTPVRGDLVVVDNPGIDRFFAEHTDDFRDMTYLLPQGEHVILGGTAERGRSDVDPDGGIAEAIVRRCAAVEPSLRSATVREHRVGLRPTRARIRIGPQRGPEFHVVHNYGHGGGGVSMSWGCAGEVLATVQGL